LLRAFFALVEDDGTRPKFIDDLAAGAAGRAWNSVIVGDGDGVNLKFWAMAEKIAVRSAQLVIP